MIDVVPEADAVLEEAHVVAGDIMMLLYTEDVKSRLCAHRLDGTRIKALEFPVGSVFEVSGERKYNHFLFSMTSFDTPRIIYEVDIEGGSFDATVFRRTTVSMGSPPIGAAHEATPLALPKLNFGNPSCRLDPHDTLHFHVFSSG